MSLVKELIEAGIHFGQRRSNWNPKMAPYIHGVRGGIHIIDIKETVKGLLLAKKYLGKIAADGKDIVFVGTKRQARATIEEQCAEAKLPYVTERWLGGTLTNFRTIRERLKRLVELEGLVESGEIKTYSKKMESQLMREMRKIYRNLNGIRDMSKLPGALIAIDVNRETNALREARNLGIPTICLLDTDGDPDLVDIPVPGNDDSMRTIAIFVREMCAAIEDGRKRGAVHQQGAEEAPAEEGGQPRRRSRRSQFRAEEPPAAPAAEDAPPAADPESAPTAPEVPAASDG
ncbi:MAG: 30S ribosomal protein S2 [Planctomycetota bacterium]|nr:30S ribosomal protein S2 [Planctomycetota bacterium]